MRDYRDEYGGSRIGILEFLLGAVIGGFIGAIIGILVAPRPGTETRAQLAENMSTFQEKMNKILEEARMNSEDLIKTTRSSLEEKMAVLMDAIEAGKRAAGEKRREWFGPGEGGDSKESAQLPGS